MNIIIEPKYLYAIYPDGPFRVLAFDWEDLEDGRPRCLPGSGRPIAYFDVELQMFFDNKWGPSCLYTAIYTWETIKVIDLKDSYIDQRLPTLEIGELMEVHYKELKANIRNAMEAQKPLLKCMDDELVDDYHINLKLARGNTGVG